MSASLTNKPTLIESEDKRFRFLISDAPSDSNLMTYLKELQKYNTKHLVRVCQSTYDKEPLERSSISVHDWPFDDGSAPPSSIINKWLELIDSVFPDPKKSKNKANSPAPADATHNNNSTATPQSPAAPADPAQTCIAIHCVAGLGRAPLLVAIALMEKTGMSALDAISFIRKKRKGAINAKQVEFIEKYKPKNRNANCKVM